RGLHNVGIMESRLDGQPGVSQTFGLDTTGCRMVTMTRQHLYAAMLHAAQRHGIEIRTSSQVTSASTDGTLTAGGETFKADLVIGADGVKSAVRDSLGIKVHREIYNDGI